MFKEKKQQETAYFNAMTNLLRQSEIFLCRKWMIRKFYTDNKITQIFAINCVKDTCME